MLYEGTVNYVLNGYKTSIPRGKCLPYLDMCTDCTSTQTR